MDLNVHLLTKNNGQTIEKTLVSLKPLQATVSITDLGSTDSTISICRSFGHEVQRRPYDKHRGEILNGMVARSTHTWQMYIHPWESLVQGHEQIRLAKHPCYYLSIIQGQVLNKEVRIWQKAACLSFVNPVFEYLDAEPNIELGAILYSEGMKLDGILEEIEDWKNKNPTLADPHYYRASVLLGLQRYDEFLKTSEHYMFLQPGPSKSSVLNRYYYAMVQLLHCKKVRPVLQNLNICLCHRPLMAEFWCLTGDVYYHLLNKFGIAKEFYENAIILGSRKLQSDRWPMDISKYGEYPERMIESCNEILKTRSIYHSPA